MDVDLIFKIAAIGILVAVLNLLLVRSGREEQASLEHRIVDAGTDEDKDQRRDDRVRNSYLRLQPLGILGIALVDALKEFLAVLDILRVRIDLIHQPVLFAVFFGCPVRNLFHKSDDVLRVGGRHLHKNAARGAAAD